MPVIASQRHRSVTLRLLTVSFIDPSLTVTLRLLTEALMPINA
ncbi:MAG: hypothetical protein U0840_07945 [Gemmataceae bacterium]